MSWNFRNLYTFIQLFSVVFSVKFNGQDMPVIEGLVNTAITLPCNVSSPPGDKVVLVLWYKEGTPDAIYTYDTRETTELQVQTVSSKIHGHVDFRVGKLSYLTIRRASLNDSGKYECRIDYLLAPSRTSLIEVIVVDPPKALVIRRTSGDIISFTITVNLGDTVKMSCIVSGGKNRRGRLRGTPRPRVWWSLNNTQIDEAWNAFNGHMTQNDLVLEGVQRELHQGKVSCSASNSNITEPLHKEVILLLYMQPENVEIVGLPDIMHEGRHYNVSCVVKGSRPEPITTWALTKPELSSKSSRFQVLTSNPDDNTSSVPNIVKQRFNLSPSKSKNFSNKLSDHSKFRSGRPEVTRQRRSFGLSHKYIRACHGNKSVEILADSSLDGAQLHCTGTNNVLPDKPVTDTVKLNVYYAPRIEINLGSSLRYDNIREGVDVYFKCSVKANPPVRLVTWLSKGKEVKASPRNGVVISRDHLVLQKVNRKWSGPIACRGGNGLGAAESKPFQLNVMYAPVCSNPVRLIWASIGEEVIVSCRVAAHPPNVTYHWTLTNSVTQETVPPERLALFGLESQLRYRPEKPHDYGRLQCWAQNILGRQKKPCVVTVKTAGSPSPPANCSVHNQTWKGFDVSCSRASNFFHAIAKTEITIVNKKQKSLNEISNASITGTSRVRYLFTIRESGTDVIVYNITSPGGRIRVTDLTPGLDYIISVSRFNAHGMSRHVQLEALTLRAAENRMRNKDLYEPNTTKTPVAILVACVAGVIILGIFSIYMCKKHQANKPPHESINSDVPFDVKLTPSENLPTAVEGHQTATQKSSIDEVILDTRDLSQDRISESRSHTEDSQESFRKKVELLVTTTSKIEKESFL